MVVKGKPRFYPPTSLVAAESKLKGYLAKHRPSEPLEGAVRVAVKWLFLTKIKKLHGAYKITKPDLDNMEKLLFDCMEDLKFFANDAQIACKNTEKFWTVEVPGIWISIEEVMVKAASKDPLREAVKAADVYYHECKRCGWLSPVGKIEGAQQICGHNGCQSVHFK